ncbi:MAG: hypothetical protein WAO20_08150 [Acidobacteriota bacterium]
MSLALFILSAFSLLTQAQVPSPERLPLDQLLSSRDLTKYNTEYRYHGKLEILRKAIEKRGDHLSDEIEKRNLAVIFRTLAEIRGLSAQALEISLAETAKDEVRHKEVKKLEIELRKLTLSLADLSRRVPLENRVEFDKTQQVLEELRNQLLRQLFGKAIGETAAEGETALPVGLAFRAASRPASGTASQGLWDIDKFTEAEFQRLQEAQKLVKRIDVFMDIAEQRLAEIDRRRNGIDWDQEEPNPLEFYMYQEMLHAYVRALESAMTNIDVKARDGGESTKDIRKSLRKLSEKSTEFQARLGAIQPFIREQRDRELEEVFDKAVETTTVAVKGARYGLEQLKDKD